MVGTALGNKFLFWCLMQLKYPLFVGEVEGGICRLSVFRNWDQLVMFLEEFRNDLHEFQFWDADFNPLVYNDAQSELSEKMFRTSIQAIDHDSDSTVKAYSVASNSDSLLQDLSQVKAFVRQFMQSDE